MNAYKLPILQSIIVYPLQADDFLRPSYLQRAVCNKIITFTAQHISSWQGANRVICTIELVYKQQKNETYIVSFLVPNTVVWYGESITRYGEGELVEGADRFGAVINSSTQVIIDKEKHELILNSHAWNFASLDGNLAKMWLSHESLYRSLHSSAVISAIFGLTNNLFEDHSKTTAPSSLLISERAFNNRSRAMAMGTLLLTGPSGSGTTTLANSIGAQYGAATICITAGSLYATSSTRDFSREWAQQQVQTNVMRACALRRCVLIFDDLHYLTPRRGSGGSSGSSSGADASAGAHSVLGVGAGAAAASHTDAEEGFIEVGDRRFYTLSIRY